MQSEPLRRPQLPVCEIGQNLEQYASRPVARGDKDFVVENDGTGRIHRLVGAAPPWKGKIDPTVRRVDRHQSAGGRLRLAAGKHEDAPLSMDNRRNRRGVARSPFRTRTPDFLSRGLVEPDHTWTARGPDIHDQQSAFNQRRRGPAEKILADAVLLVQVALPDQLSGCEVEAV